MPPIDPVDALTMVARKFDAAAIPYMLTGSVAALFYGRDRSTVDMDIVVDMRGRNTGQLAAALGEDYFFDAEAAEESFRRGRMYNALPLTGGPKIDLIPLTDEPFEQTKFRRRVTKDWHGTPIAVIQAIDLAISKLQWAKESRSERQLADVRAILSFGEVEADDYFYGWVERLGLEEAMEASRETRYDA